MKNRKSYYSLLLALVLCLCLTACGGSGGGTIVATGTPEQVAQNPNSFTGQYLKPVLERAWKLQGTAPAPVPEEPGRPAPAEEKASAQPPRKRKKADKK